MKSNSVQVTPRIKRSQHEALLPIPKTFAVNQLLLNTTIQGFNQSKQNNNQLRNSLYMDAPAYSTFSSNHQAQFQERQEPFYIDTIQKVKKVMRHKQDLEDDAFVESPIKNLKNVKEDQILNRKRGDFSGNTSNSMRKKQMSIAINNDLIPSFQVNNIMSTTLRDRQTTYSKQLDAPQTNRNRNQTAVSFLEISPAPSSTHRDKNISFSKHIDSFAILEKQMNIPPNISDNQSRLSGQNTQLIYNNSTQNKSCVNDQLNSYRKTLNLADKNSHNQQTYAPDITAPSQHLGSRQQRSSSDKRERFHQNTFFRLEEERTLQFVEAEDILEMAEVAIKSLNDQQVLQNRKKLYQPDILDDDNQKKIKLQDLEEDELNAHIKERIVSLQNIENFRYQKKYGLIEIQKEASQIINERNKIKQQIVSSNQTKRGLQETPFRKNSFVKHSRELQEFHIENVHNRLYKQINQQELSNSKKEQQQMVKNIKQESFNDHNHSQSVISDSKSQQPREIKDYQKILKDMKKQGEYYSKVSELLNTIYFSTPEDSFKEEELNLFRRHQQSIIEEIQAKKKR